jgi:hypothetical protein
MLHEWLHSLQWALEDHQGYPPGLMATSDGGRFAGEEGGDPCYRRRREEPSWMRFYEHILHCHTTRKMLREASPNRPVGNIWANVFCRDFLVLGPFSAAGKPKQGLDEPFLDERSGKVDLRTRPGQPAWRRIAAPSRVVDLVETFGPKDNHVAYLALAVRSETRQRAELRIGSDDGCKAWHNGQQVIFSDAPRAVAVDQDIAKIELVAGTNLILVKVANIAFGWAAVVRVCDSHGFPLPGCRYVVPRLP